MELLGLTSDELLQRVRECSASTELELVLADRLQTALEELESMEKLLRARQFSPQEQLFETLTS